MEPYILPVHKKTRKFIINGFSDQVGWAMKHVNDNVYRVDWLSLFWEATLKEMICMIAPRNENIRMDCFYSAYWLRFIWENKPNLFSSVDVVLESSVRASATNVPLEKEGYVVIEPKTHQPPNSREPKTVVNLFSSPRSFLELVYLFIIIAPALLLRLPWLIMKSEEWRVLTKKVPKMRSWQMFRWCLLVM
jgi:hypothetical protein